MKSAFRSRAPELLDDLEDRIALALKEIAGLSVEKAELIAFEITKGMAANWGGQNIYFPMALAYERSQKYREIYAEFRGHNQAALAQKYGVSVQWMYRIIKAMRIEEMKGVQHDFFTDDDPPEVAD